MSIKMQTQKCIWMECGYVEYKLCDRNFDCENCPFDKAIKQEKSASQSEKLVNEDYYNRDLMITPNHIWISKKNSIITLGIDDFAQSLFNRNCSINFPMVGSKLLEGKTFLWFIGSFGAIGFQSPVDGTVVWINEKIRDKPNLFFEENAFNIDLIKAECINFDSSKFYTIEEYENLKMQDNQLIKEFLIRKFSYESLKNTLPDGGVLIKSYINDLTRQDYYQLLKQLFNKKTMEK